MQEKEVVSPKAEDLNATELQQTVSNYLGIFLFLSRPLLVAAFKALPPLFVMLRRITTKPKMDPFSFD